MEGEPPTEFDSGQIPGLRRSPFPSGFCAAERKMTSKCVCLIEMPCWDVMISQERSRETAELGEDLGETRSIPLSSRCLASALIRYHTAPARLIRAAPGHPRSTTSPSRVEFCRSSSLPPHPLAARLYSARFQIIKAKMASQDQQPPPSKRSRPNSSSPPASSNNGLASPSTSLPPAPVSSISALGARFGSLAALSQQQGTQQHGETTVKARTRQLAQRGSLVVLQLMDSSDIECEDDTPRQQQGMGSGRQVKREEQQGSVLVDSQTRVQPAGGRAEGEESPLKGQDKGRQRAIDPVPATDDSASAMDLDPLSSDLQGAAPPSPTLRASPTSDLTPPKPSPPQIHLSSPTKGTPVPSGTQTKRTQEQIAINRQEAQAKVGVLPPLLSDPSELTLFSRRAQRQAALAAQARQAQLRKREQEQEKRRSFATASLGQYGFSVGGISRYGSGKGGFDPSSPPQQAPGGGHRLDSAEEDQRAHFKAPWIPDAKCSDEQKLVLEQVKQGGNVFFTGSAGQSSLLSYSGR